MEQQQLKEYLTPRELADKLAVSLRFIEDNTMAKKIPGQIKIGRLWRYKITEVEKALLRGTFLIEKQSHRALFPRRQLLGR